MSQRGNVLLFGLGGIGGVYACILQLSKKVNVHVVARSNYSQVKEKGLKLISPKFGNHDSIKFAGVWKSCADAAASGTKFSHVLCANKALLDAKPSLSDLLRPAISSDTAIAILQNGVGAEDPLHASFPDNTIISAVVWTGAKVLPDENGQAVVEQFNRESLTIGVDYRQGADPAVEDEKSETLVGYLKAGGGDCKVVKDVQTERWIKVIWNCCWNSLTTLARVKTNRFFESSPQALPLCYTVMREVEAVAKAKGLVIPPETVEDLINQGKGVAGGMPSSMMFDNFYGRPMETEAILGTPVKEAERLGIQVPTLLTLYTLVKALDYANANPDLCKV